MSSQNYGKLLEQNTFKKNRIKSTKLSNISKNIIPGFRGFCRFQRFSKNQGVYKKDGEDS